MGTKTKIEWTNATWNPVRGCSIVSEGCRNCVWTDITRMLTLNSSQVVKGRERHLCPLQLDLADRVINQLTNPGETVLDPFSGIGTVPARAVGLGRKGIGWELAHSYFMDGAMYCAAAEKEVSMPMLFDVLQESEEAAA